MGLKKVNKKVLIVIVQETNDAVELATSERMKNNKGNLVESNEIDRLRKVVQETIFNKLVEENDSDLFEEEEDEEED